uniref:Addiction module antidote protein n=1 Tax=Siphoviridae sp. ctiPM17 TaxID=2825623 RepID=A0A8S5NTU4_9CAUD|nr:MAG TPA: addiction module antidote protein [Siphoviridae sp. ctiPM17]
MNKYKIIISQEAEDILTASYDYLYIKNPRAATKWLDGMLQTIQSLDTFPEQGSIIPEASFDAAFLDLHQIFYSMNNSGNCYRIIYKITKDVCKIVNVVTIRSAYQQPLA